MFVPHDSQANNNGGKDYGGKDYLDFSHLSLIGTGPTGRSAVSYDESVSRLRTHEPDCLRQMCPLED